MVMLSVSLFFSGLQWFAIACLIVGIVFVFVFAKLGSYWLQAYMCGADVSMKSLIVMSLLKLDVRLIVNAKIMARQAGLSIDRRNGTTTARLQAHHLAGGDITKVVQASVAAKQAGIELDFERAAAIDLAGRDVLLAVQTSISPMIIRCPPMDKSGTNMLSAVAKNGVEVRADARVTVRTQLDQLIGGATEETIIARVGQAIISAIGSSNSHMDVLALPSRISKGAMQNGLDKNTAFAIVSIDIYHLVIGENIGARLQSDQAAADVRIAQAFAEGRRAEAVALTQLMKAKIAEFRAALILAEAEIPLAMAEAFRAGRLTVRPTPKQPNKIAAESPRPTVMPPALTTRNNAPL